MASFLCPHCGTRFDNLDYNKNYHCNECDGIFTTHQHHLDGNEFSKIKIPGEKIYNLLENGIGKLLGF